MTAQELIEKLQRIIKERPPLANREVNLSGVSVKCVAVKDGEVRLEPSSYCTLLTNRY